VETCLKAILNEKDKARERERKIIKECKPLDEHKKCRQLAGSKCSRCRRPGKKTQIYFGRLYYQVFVTYA